MWIAVDKRWLLTGLLVTVLFAGCGQTGGEVSAAESAGQAQLAPSETAPAAGLVDNARTTAADAVVAERTVTAPKTAEPIVPDPELILPEGTVLTARLIPTISTETHALGDSFEATLAESVTVDGKVVAPAGSTLRGVVVEADKGGRVDGRARVAVQLTEMTVAPGQPVEISTDAVARTAPATKKKDAEKIGIGAGLGAAIGAIAGGGKGAAIGAAAGGGAGTGAVLATRGAPAEIPSETVLSFRLRHAVKIS